MEFLKDGLQFLAEHWALTACLTIISLVYWHYVKTYTTIKRLGFKGPTPWPLVGTSGGLLLGKEMHLVWDEYCKKYGKVFGMYVFQMPTVIVSDTEMLKSILVKDFEKFHDRPTMGMNLPEPIASMLTTVTGQRWKDIRSVLSPTFTSGKLKQMMFIMNEASDTLLGKLENAANEGKVIDIYGWQQGVSMEVILSSAFGLKADSQTNPNDKITEMAKKVMDPSFLPIIVMMIPVIGKYLSTKLAKSSRFGFGWSPLVKVAKGIIKKRRESSKDGEQRKDALGLMLAAQNPENKGHHLTEEELLAQMVLFIAAGYDTSSNTLGLTCYHLALFPEIQDKLVEEINEVCGLSDPVTYELIQKMPYLEACISETLRLYPPGFALDRVVSQSCTINGVPFEKGMGVFVPVYTMQRDEKYWPEPETFKPERFLPENKDSIHQFTYLPFGDGPRNCIGMRFALMEMKTVLVRMLQKYRLVRAPETSVPIKLKVRGVLAPAEPVYVRIEKRDK